MLAGREVHKADGVPRQLIGSVKISDAWHFRLRNGPPHPCLRLVARFVSNAKNEFQTRV